MPRPMIKVDGAGRLIRKFQQMFRKSQNEDNLNVIVGYSAAYAIYVHEDLTAVHINGQAKYLEQPARTHRDQMARMAKTVRQQTGSTRKALLAAGLFLQGESQKLVPVASGYLRASAFTKIE